MRRVRALILVSLCWTLAVAADAAVEPRRPKATKPPKGAKAKDGATVKAPPPPPPLVIEGVTVEPRVGRAMERVDLAVRLSGGPFANPDDAKEIDVQAVFEAPGDEPFTVPGFWFQDFRVDEAAKRLVPQGEPGFRIRFLPQKPVVYTCTVRATAGARQAEAEPLSLQVLGARADAPAFLRIHPDNPAYYQNPRTGKTVFLMGCRLDVHQFGDEKVQKTYGTAGLCDRKEGVTPEGQYATWQWCRDTIDELADAGATCVRLPLHSWYIPLEAQGAKTWIHGLTVGRYVAGNAWIADQIIERCASRGLAVLPVTWNQHPVALKDGAPYPMAGENQALAYRRLRYQVARWSYSPAVLGWTLFDNGSFVPSGYDYWRKMVVYLRGLDPYGHFVFNTPYGLDQREYLYLHPYGYPLATFNETDGRPFVVSLHGTPHHAERLARSGLWASLASGRAGVVFAHAWHLRQAEAVEPVYRTASALLRDIDLGACLWKRAYFEPIAGPGGLQVHGMVGGRRRAVVFAIRSSAHLTEPYPPANGNVIRVGDFDKGAYVVLWYGPDRPEPLDRSEVNCGDGTIVVSVPDGIRWHRLMRVVPAGEAASR